VSRVYKISLGCFKQRFSVLRSTLGARRGGERGRKGVLGLTRGLSGLPNGESSTEFSLSEELLLWRCANFLRSASAMRAAGSSAEGGALPPLRRPFTRGLPPGDLRRGSDTGEREKWFKNGPDMRP